MEEITPVDLKNRMSSGDKLILIDVREPYEHDEFNLGGLNIPVSELPFRLDELKENGDCDVVLYCQSGNRSGLAQKLLSLQYKFDNTITLKGGVNAWREAM